MCLKRWKCSWKGYFQGETWSRWTFDLTQGDGWDCFTTPSIKSQFLIKFSYTKLVKKDLKTSHKEDHTTHPRHFTLFLFCFLIFLSPLQGFHVELAIASVIHRGKQFEFLKIESFKNVILLTQFHKVVFFHSFPSWKPSFLPPPPSWTT